MEMKWQSIIDGDLSMIPKDAEFLFTVFDEQDDEIYVIIGQIESDSYSLGVTAPMHNFYEAKNVKAWMDFPPPYKAKKKCYDCNRSEEWCDEFGDRWLECKFHEHVPVTELKPADCPLRQIAR